MRTTALVLFVLMTPAVAVAQPPAAAPDSLMERLNWLVGEWSGVAWIEMRPGQRDTTAMAESVQRKAGGLVLAVEGIGTRIGSAEPDTVHAAFATISVDPATQRFEFRGWRQPGGVRTDTEPLVGDKSFMWGLSVPQGRVRYTITLNGEGQWYEIGEFSREGQSWSKFFEMTLTRRQ